MLTREDVRDARADLAARLARRGSGSADDLAVMAAVADILDGVRTRGDAAVRDYTAQFDGAELTTLRVSRSECEDAVAATPPELRAALELAAGRIHDYHKTQSQVPPATYSADGVSVTEAIRPVDRAGLYVPGGRAAYPSTVLMTAIPARIAGVPERVLCVPPAADGSVTAVTLAAALLTNVEEVYRVGGAQAVAAMAYGTETIAPVDVIVGPGNAYVDAAKRAVAGAGIVGIDGPAGPSELVVIADDGADARAIALDLAAQAEHGPGGAAWLVTWDETVIDAVIDALAAYVGDSPRAGEILATFERGGHALLVRDAEQAVAVANLVAPEHLELMVREAEELVHEIRHAGAVFVDAPTALGDYVAGANHVLPTGGAARFASALRVDDFRTHMHVVRATSEGIERIGPAAVALARAEGLVAHAESVERRLRR
ncbi:MAG: histidinol dehydrogenase [Acidimicrobiia bacterium]